MRLIARTNADQVGRFMSDFFNDQVAYALQRAVRKTTLDVQEAQREHQGEVFTIRRKGFMRKAVKVRDWPTKADPTGIVRIEPPGAPRTTNVLAEHEEGGKRGPAPGHTARSVEREVRPSEQRLAPKRLRPKALKLRRVSSGGPKGFEVFEGRHRTFMIRRPNGAGAIFQRTKRGSAGTFEGTRLLWALTPKGVLLEPTLNFHQNAVRTLEDKWLDNMADAWDQALRTAR